MTTDTPFNTRSWGAEHEELALAYLQNKGYRLVRKNFRFGRAGEIDLVMRDRHVYVFVEVKARRSAQFGAPEDAVTPIKRKRILRIAHGFFHVMKLTEYEARFDVIAIDYATGAEGAPEIRHHIDAFR